MRSISFAFLDRDFIRRFGAIALPIALMMLINFGVKAVDTLMLGMVGEIQLSGAALANQFSFVFMVVGGSGVAAGCGVLTAQYWGADNKERVREIFAFMYRITVVINIIFAAIAFFAPHIVMGILTGDYYVISEGVIYLRIMSIGFLVWGFTNASTTILRSVGVVKISVVVFSISLVISASLNYVLIFGHFGFPALGIAGAAIATVTARFVEFTIIAVYLLRIEKNLAFRVKNLVQRGKGIVREFMKHSFPVVMNEVFWASSFFILMIIIGRIGREFVAANAIGSLMMQFSGMVIFSVASTTAVIIGNTIGEGEYGRAKQIGNGMLVISIGVGLLCFAIIQAVRVPFINLYTLSDVARMYALQITNIISVFIIFISVAVISMMGTMRGGGDTRFVMVADVIFMWIISIPMGAFVGFVLEWPVWAVYMVLRSEDIFKTITVLWRIPSGKWLKDVTKPTT